MRRVKGALVLFLALGAVPLPNVAHAIGRATPQSREDRAVNLAKSGRELFDQGRFKEALAAFQEAGALAKSPVIDLYVARCQRNLGALTAARETYERVAATSLAKDAPEAFQSAVTDAKKELEQVIPRIPKVTFRLEAAAGAELRVDGRAVSAAAPLPLDLGSHRAELVRDGKTLASTTFELADAQTLEVVLKAGDATPVAPRPDGPAAPTPPADGAEGSLVPGAVVLSAGGVGLLLGAITGGLAIGKESDLAAACPDARCPASVQEDIDDANLLATISTVGFVAGGVISAVGITLLIIRPGGEDDPAAASISAGLGYAQLTVPF